METNELYGCLLQDIQHELELHNRTLPVSREVFMLCDNMDSFVIDYEKLKNLNSLDFLYAVYICVLKRLPAEDDLAYWTKRSQLLKAADFQKELVLGVHAAPERMLRKTFITNCPFIPVSDNPEDQNANARKLILYQKVHALYTKLPAPLRQFAKNILKKRMMGKR